MWSVTLLAWWDNGGTEQNNRPGIGQHNSMATWQDNGPGTVQENGRKQQDERPTSANRPFCLAEIPEFRII